MNWPDLLAGDVLLSKSTRKPCTYVVCSIEAGCMDWYMLEDALRGRTDLSRADERTNLADAFRVLRGSEYLT